jgi:peptide/nickel transport system substrate-binding protein
MFIKLNDLVVGGGHIIPVVFRPRVSAANTRLTAHLSGWDNDMWAVASWYKDGGAG